MTSQNHIDSAVIVARHTEELVYVPEDGAKPDLLASLSIFMLSMVPVNVANRANKTN